MKCILENPEMHSEDPEDPEYAFKEKINSNIFEKLPYIDITKLGMYQKRKCESCGY